MKIIILIFSILLLTACSKSEDVYLEKYNIFGKWERTSIMFGFYDNNEACDIVKNGLVIQFPEIQYRCAPVNNTWVSFTLKFVKTRDPQ